MSDFREWTCVLEYPPVARSVTARNLFLASAIVTILIFAGISHLRGTWDPMDPREPRGLSPIFFFLFTAFDYRGAMCSLLILVCAVLVPARPWIRALLSGIGRRPGIVAACSAALMCGGALFVYQDHPLSMDEYTVLFQSEVFAAGHLSGQLPAPLLDWLLSPRFHTLFFNVSEATGKIVSAYWPSFAILMAPFTLAGIPWACNPVLSAAAVLAIHRLTFRLFGDIEAAGLAVLLTVASPVFFADGISYYSMQAHLLANTVYALLLIDPTPRRALWAGIVGSIALTLHNPVPHLLFAAPWIFWIAIRRERLRLIGPLIVGYLPLCLLLGLGWFLFAGHLMRDGTHVMLHAGGPALIQRITWPFSSPSPTILLARLIGIAKVCLWAVPGLAILAIVGAWRRRDDERCRTLVASAVLTLVGYMFVSSDQGHGWGFRFFHSAWMVLPVLAGGALSSFSQAEAHSTSFDREQTRAFVVSCALGALVIGVGLRGMQIREFISDDLSQLPPYSGANRHIVFVDTNHAFYGADLVQNDPWLRGNVIRMLSRGASANAALMREYFPNFHLVLADARGAVWSVVTSRTVGPTSRRGDLSVSAAPRCLWPAPVPLLGSSKTSGSARCVD